VQFQGLFARFYSQEVDVIGVVGRFHPVHSWFALILQFFHDFSMGLLEVLITVILAERLHHAILEVIIHVFFFIVSGIFKVVVQLLPGHLV